MSLKPYLEKYQNEKPMAVFMSTDLEKIFMALMFKFMKKDVLGGANAAKLARMDLDKKDDMALNDTSYNWWFQHLVEASGDKRRL